MTLTGEYEPGTWEWANKQVAAYEASGGREDNTIRGRPIVVVTSVGARSGRLRKNPVIRVEHEGEYAAVASRGGDPENPAWYHNLLAHPEVHLQDGDTPRPYVARLVTGEERATWWDRAVETFPWYAEYQERTEREIPVFVLGPAEA